MRNKHWLVIALALLCVPHGARAIEVQEITSKSGITAWLVEEHTNPILTVKVAFRDSGNASDPRGQAGRAMLAAELLLEGAGDLDAHAFHQALEERAISLDTGVDEDMMSVSMQTLSEHTGKAFELLGLALTKPAFAEPDVARIRALAQSNLKQYQEQPGYIAGVALMEATFGDHPYSRSKLGTATSLAAITQSQIKAFVTERLARSTMVVAVVGDITPDALRKLLDSSFGGLPAAPSPLEIGEAKPIEVAATRVITKDIPQSVAVFALPGVARNSADFFPAYVMNYLLGGDGLTSRLGVELREKRGLAYSAGSVLDPMKHAAVLRGSFATRNDAAKEAVDTMRELLGELAQKGFDAKTLEDGKQYLTGAFPLQLDSNGEVANYLIVMQLFDLGKDYIDRRNSLINAVTLEQVNAIAAKLLDPSRLVSVVVGKPEGMK